MRFEIASAFALLPAVALCANDGPAASAPVGSTVIGGQTYVLKGDSGPATATVTSTIGQAVPGTSSQPQTSGGESSESSMSGSSTTPPSTTSTPPIMTPPTNSTSSPVSTVAAGATQTVKVGEGGNVFTPDRVDAAVGAMIEYQFYGPGSFSVAQSSFDLPCAYSENGTYSGVFDTSSGSNSSTFRVTVADTNPMWVFCGVGDLCKSGMAAVINPPADQSLTAYQDKAKTIDAVPPITNTEAHGGTVEGTSSNSTTTTTSKNTTIATTTSTTTKSSTSASKTSTSSPSASKSGQPSEGTLTKVPMVYTSLLLAVVVAVGFGTLL